MPDRLVVVPLTLGQANLYVERQRRDSKPVRGIRFTIGAAWGDDPQRVAIAGRPVTRLLEADSTGEVLRPTTTGAPNVRRFSTGLVAGPHGRLAIAGSSHMRSHPSRERASARPDGA